MKHRKLLEAAVRAPSGDNCQPWRFAVAGDEIRIYNRPERDTSLYNYRQRASLVAHGALIENLGIAAAGEGCRVRISTFPDAANPMHVATVQVETGATCDEPLYQAVFARTINRRSYCGEPLNSKQRTALLNGTDTAGGARLVLLEKQQEIQTLARVIGCNDRLVFENRYLHRFLFDHLRWSEQEAVQSGDGLDLRTLELAPPDRLAMHLFKSYPLTAFLNRFGLSRFVAAKATRLARSAAALGAVVIPASTSLDYLNAGRLMERVWLEATRLGLSFHLMTGITFLMQSVAENADLGLSAGQSVLLDRLRQEAEKICGLDGEIIALFFRIGHSKPPQVRSLRLSLDEQVEVENP
jgi:hypothetical protein